MIIPEASFEWLKAEAVRQLSGCKITAHDRTILYTPDGEGNYEALWTRDFSYMVENVFDLIPTDQILAAIKYLLNGQREDGCIPDRVQADGYSIYSAGPVNQPLGDPPADNSQFMVKLVFDYVNNTGDLDFFKQVSDQLVSAMNFTPRSQSGLVFIDPQNPHSPYGFTDTIAKTGDLFFSSLLYWEASKILTELFEKINRKELVQDFQKRASQIEKNIYSLWDPQKGMYLAASHGCSQVDIWGNAFAIYIDFPLGNKKRKIENYLAQNFTSIVKRGQIRHLPKPEHWEKTLFSVPPETYQNGAYWGTASGWIAYALFESHPNLAKNIFKELIYDYQKNGVFECINNDYTKIKNYVVSVINPLGAIKKLSEKNNVIN
jgi:hypothetical protein